MEKTENTPLIIDVKTNTLLFGERELELFKQIELYSREHKVNELFINLRGRLFISKEGLKLLIKMVGKSREMGFMPYILAGARLKEMLELTSLVKIVKVVTDLNFERENTTQVEILEKDMLWGTLEGL